MNSMPDGVAPHWIVMLAIILLVALVLTATIVGLVTFFTKEGPTGNLLAAERLYAGPGRPLPRLEGGAVLPGGSDEAEQDVVFVLPDISHYTRFMTSNRFAFGHARHVVFELINAMLEAGCRTLHLSKLEGDAMLFFADPREAPKERVGETVTEIFAGFYRTQKRLIEANICPCSACTHIGDLDLKIFVHRGRATPFRFRGSVDFFGMDVIVLHRLMKNSVGSHRYVMVTGDAESACSLPLPLTARTLRETVDHVGEVVAQVYEIDDATVAMLRDRAPAPPRSVALETVRKLARNAATLWTALMRRTADSRAPRHG